MLYTHDFIENNGHGMNVVFILKSCIQGKYLRNTCILDSINTSRRQVGMFTFKKCHMKTHFTFFVNLSFSKIESSTFLKNGYFLLKKLLFFENRDFLEKCRKIRLIFIRKKWSFFKKAKILVPSLFDDFSKNLRIGINALKKRPLRERIKSLHRPVLYLRIDFFWLKCMLA